MKNWWIGDIDSGVVADINKDNRVVSDGLSFIIQSVNEKPANWDDNFYYNSYYSSNGYYVTKHWSVELNYHRYFN